MNKAEHDKRMLEQSKKIQEAHEKQMQANRGKKLTPKQIEVLNTISEYPDITNKQLMLLLGIGKSGLMDHIENLQIRDLVKFKYGLRGVKSYRVNKTVMRKIMLIN